MSTVHTRRLPAFILYLAFGTVSSAQSADPVDELKACARTADRDSRIACYEALGKRVLEAEAATASNDSTRPEPVAAEMAPVEAVASTPVLKDSLGGEKFGQKPNSEEEKNKGLVTSCKKGPDRKWYFYFNSGQIWKQIDDDQLRFKDCRFLATVTKDMFGYQMQIEGRSGKIRISRKK